MHFRVYWIIFWYTTDINWIRQYFYTSTSVTASIRKNFSNSLSAIIYVRQLNNIMAPTEIKRNPELVKIWENILNFFVVRTFQFLHECCATHVARTTCGSSWMFRFLYNVRYAYLHFVSGIEISFGKKIWV